MNGFSVQSGTSTCGAGVGYGLKRERPAYLNFPESSDPVVRLRFLPEAYLFAACQDGYDNGVESILYFQLLIGEEE